MLQPCKLNLDECTGNASKSVIKDHEKIYVCDKCAAKLDTETRQTVL